MAGFECLVVDLDLGGLASGQRGMGYVFGGLLSCGGVDLVDGAIKSLGLDARNFRWK